jgi:hypothetical protein
MRLLFVYVVTATILFATACSVSAKDKSRKNVARALIETVGESADPQIAFRRDSSHLLIQLLTVAFPTVSEDELTRRSWGIARSALRSYDDANQLDSITVLYRERVRDGMWWIRHTRTFAVDSLKDVSMRSSVSPSSPNTR